MRLSPELIDLLSRRALAEGTTRSELIRRLVEAGLHETHRIHAGFRQLPQGASTASSSLRSAVLGPVRGLPALSATSGANVLHGVQRDLAV